MEDKKPLINPSTITITTLPNGQLSIAINGQFLPSTIFEAAAMLTRFANQMLDAAMIQQMETQQTAKKLGLL